MLKGTMIKSQTTGPQTQTQQLTIGWSNWKVFHQTNTSKLVSCLTETKRWTCYSKNNKLPILDFWVMEIQSTHEFSRMSWKLSTYQVKIQRLEVGWLLEQFLKVFCWWVLGYILWVRYWEQIAFSIFCLKQKYVLNQGSYPNSLTKGPQQLFWTLGMPRARKNRGMLERSLKLEMCWIILISFKFLETISWWESTEF